VQSSALVDGVVWLHSCSVRTVAAHFSIGSTGHNHTHSRVVRLLDRRQDSVLPVVLACTSPHSPKRSSVFKFRPPLWRAAASRLSSFRSCLGAQQLAVLDRRPRRNICFSCRRIADVEGPIAPHGVHDHRQFACHGDRRIVMTASFRQRSPQVLTLSLPGTVSAAPTRPRKARAVHLDRPPC
jgi:hypothetical protein